MVRAPGRVNIIGEHTDYNQGFVLPAAVDKQMLFAVSLNQENTIRLVAHDLNETFSIAADEVRRSDTAWANYILGVVAQLQERGVAVPGFDCAFGGNVPIGSGMSSSAAVECGIGYALNELLNAGLDKMELARAGQLAEHTYAGVMCGIMDQFASLFGKDGHVVRLDCRSLEYEYFPFDTQACRVVLCNSGIKHALADSEYNKRRQECERGVAILQQYHPEIQSLRDASPLQVKAHHDALGDLTYRRCLYVVEENQRVEAACRHLLAGELPQVGQLLYASHAGLRDNYEVSSQELDLLVELARPRPGVYGARMMGGGFGGCTINLVQAEHVADFVAYMSQAYEAQTGIKLETYETSIVDGVSTVGN
ncbi:galactokinase [Hymenobacter saemangeumensis]|uniref:Galactokinase n=1 Tax=Hymenobacter saemangeumensis TaxID=1084522 RepID=A0ABP8IQK2_9BACT